MKNLIQRQKATIKIEILKNSKNKVSIKLYNYTNATSEMSNEERRDYISSEGFNCPNEHIFLSSLRIQINNLVEKIFVDAGVENVEIENYVVSYS